jgi:hypothetical protein
MNSIMWHHFSVVTAGRCLNPLIKGAIVSGFFHIVTPVYNVYDSPLVTFDLNGTLI